MSMLPITRVHGFAPLVIDGVATPVYPVHVCRCDGTILAPGSEYCPNCLDAGAAFPVKVDDHVWTPEPGPLPGQEACVYCWHHEDEHQCPGDLVFGSLTAPALGCALSGVN